VKKKYIATEHSVKFTLITSKQNILGPIPFYIQSVPGSVSNRVVYILIIKANEMHYFSTLFW